MSLAGRLALVSVLVVAFAACSSTGRKRVDTATSDLARFRKEVVNAQNQIKLVDQLMASVSRSSGSDLERAYASYRKQMDVLESRAQKARKRARAMEKSGRNYFTEWEKQASQMSSASIREQANLRRKELLAAYDQLIASMKATRVAFLPYEASLTDIRTFLDNDLTPSGLRAIDPEIQEAHGQGREVHEKLDQVLAATMNVERSLSPSAG